ncbi:MAG TPA: MFS transporter [Anaerolineaceae bacterium]
MSISLFTWGLGEGMFLYFQPLYLQKWGANPVEIGGILGLMGIAMAIAQAPAGYLADRIGPRPVMWSSWVLGTIAAVLMATARSLPVFVAGMLTYGLTAFVAAPMNSYITAVRGRWSVERSLTVVSAMFHLGAVAGPILGGLVGERLGLPVVYRISAGIFFLSTVMVFFARRAPEEAGSAMPALQGQPTPGLITNPRFLGLLGLVALTMFALYLPQPLTPNYLQNQHGFNLATIGWMGATGSLGNAVLMLALGHLNAPLGFVVGQVLVGIFALTMWLSHAPALFFAGYFFIGGYRLSRSMALAFARRLVKPGETGLAFGLVEMGNAISAIAAPLVAGFLYNQNPAWMYVASLGAIAAVIAINRMVMPGLTRIDPNPAGEPTLRALPALADPSTEEYSDGA